MFEWLWDKENAYPFAFAVGLVFIAVFAKDRLDMRIAGDEKARRQKRFVDMLAPSKFVRWQIFLRGWLTYVVLLTIVYTTVCALAEPLIDILGGLVSESSGFKELDPSSPMVPLIVSLSITGLMPQMLLISRLEETARRFTLRVVSIPDSFNDLTDALFSVPLDTAALSPSAGDEIERICELAERDTQGAIDVARLRQSLVKLHAFLETIGEERPWPGTAVFQQFHTISRDVSARSRAVAEDFRDLAERSMAQERHEGIDARWISVANRLDSVTDDICALIAILAENAPRLPDREPAPQNAMREFIRRGRLEADKSHVQFQWLLISFAIIALMMFVVGFIGGLTKAIEHAGLETDIEYGVVWLIAALVTYAPAALVCWAIRDHAERHGRWLDELIDGNQPQLFVSARLYGRLLIVGWIVSAACLFVFGFANFTAGQSDFTPEIVLERFWKEAEWEASLLYGVLGGLYGTVMVRFFDVRDCAAIVEGSECWRNEGNRTAVWLTLGLGSLCFFASYLHLEYIKDTIAGANIWKQVLFQTAAAASFGAVAGWTTIIALGKIDEADRERRARREIRERGPLVGVDR